uniref:Uncharacterized protein n=1 Tax=Ficedula albicollis TaxID=59894 RepID=A0A803W7I9_FICAL
MKHTTDFYFNIAGHQAIHYSSCVAIFGLSFPNACLYTCVKLHVCYVFVLG